MATPKPMHKSAKIDLSPNKFGKAGKDVLNLVLDKLDAMDNDEVRNRRNATRCLFRKIDVPVRVHHPGGSTSSKSVATRNLSAHGMGILYNSFLYNGTAIEVVLKCRTGGEDVIKGTVVFCAHIGGVFHQIGIRFDQKIFPKLYLDPGSYDEVDGEAPVDASTLSGSVLYIDDQLIDRTLMEHLLKSTKLKVTTVATAREALAKIESTTFDMILCDLNLESATGEQVIADIRSIGYKGFICLVTAETTPSRLKAAQAAGAVGVLQKPYELTKLMAVLGMWMGKSAGVDISSLTTTLPKSADTSALVEAYVTSVRQLVNDIRTSVETQDTSKIRAFCMTIKGTGAGYGFAVLADAAKEVIKSLDATSSITESSEQIQSLIDLCKRLST